MLSPNTILQKRYRIIRQLAEGGMGAVYEAVDQRVNAIVALKETKVGRIEDSIHFFEREAALLANLRHQSLPKVMDYFVEGDGEFLVMEYIAGHDLKQLLDRRDQPFDLHEVLRWAGELLKVLEYLHGRTPPILHRDIKPANVKITEEGEIYLLDFGLAKGAAGQMPTLQTSRSVRGYTLVYAPLEQIVGHATDQRSDLYSLGATLYNLLTGIYPIDAPTRYGCDENEEPDPLQQIDKLNPLVPPEVAAIIHRAMAISRKNRPASATEIRIVFQRVEEERNRELERLRQEEELRRHEEEAEQKRLVEESIRRALEARRQAEEDEKRRLEAEARRRQEEAEQRHAIERNARLPEQNEARRQLEEERKPITPDENRTHKGKANSAIAASIDALCQEQGIDRELVIDAMKEAVHDAVRKSK